MRVGWLAIESLFFQILIFRRVAPSSPSLLYGDQGNLPLCSPPLNISMMNRNKFKSNIYTSYQRYMQTRTKISRGGFGRTFERLSGFGRTVFYVKTKPCSAEEVGGCITKSKVPMGSACGGCFTKTIKINQ